MASAKLCATTYGVVDRCMSTRQHNKRRQAPPSPKAVRGPQVADGGGKEAHIEACLPQRGRKGGNGPIGVVRFERRKEHRQGGNRQFNAEHLGTRYLVGHFGGFPLRLSWLPRLVDRYSTQERVPSSLEELACELGIGKNMAKSLRAWGRAAGFLHDDGRVSDLARWLFGEHDPFLEHSESVALLHWLIASNHSNFTAVSWIFSRAKSGTFTTQDATSEFRDYLALNGATYALGTLRGDIEPILRMHGGWSDSPTDEMDDRFFSQLRLINVKRAERTALYSRSWESRRSCLSDGILLYALLQCLARRGTPSSALSDLHMARADQAAPGIVFGLTRDGFFGMVERLDRDRRSGVSLSAMPGEDAMLTATGDNAVACARRDLGFVDQRLFQQTLV